MADLRRPISDPFETVFYAREAGLVGTVAYKLLDNDGNEVIAATTAGISEIAPGVYKAEPNAPGTEGQWSVVWSKDGTFGALTLGIDALETYDPGVSAPTIGDVVPMSEDEFGLSVGPCQSWTTADAVAECCDGADSDTSIFDDSIVAASELLYALSSNRFSGECGPKRVRPCGVSSCFFPRDMPVSWTGSGWHVIEGPSDPPARSRGCGCTPLSVVPLAGWVREILEVTIDGELVDPATYRLDEHRRLVRTYEDGERAYWPSCDDAAADYTEEGTFSILYTYGLPVPASGQLAARELACAIYRSCGSGAAANDADCVLPNNVVKVVRQGITLELKTFTGWGYDNARKQWATGLPLVDAFLNAFNPRGRRKRRTTVWSPDLARYPRPYGDALEATS
ncbi:MAG TPA: hypothetical protein VFO73_06610 [Candidatus Limnocylindrales bacterium]|nr:hypothetical protein [Candidatus Limnocylindrales bacterium]